MRINLLLRLLVAGGLLAGAAGCGQGSAGDGGAGGSGVGGGSTHGPEGSTQRARDVSEAWSGSKAARIWRERYFPMDAAVQLPAGAFRNEADERAYATQNFELGGPLPSRSPKEGEVRWRGGGTLALPVSSARAAYEKLARGRNSGPSLVVTGARLGTMTLSTSRGPAAVPAWLFTVRGYDTPLKRVAVAPSELPRPPVGPVEQTSDEQTSDFLLPLSGIGPVSRDEAAVTLRAQHGSCDKGPQVAVLETADNVVFSAGVRDRSDGPCTSEMRSKKVTVRLDRPVGDRMLLDAFTGRPVPYAAPPGSLAPSWS
ncbi:hypothetical protein C6Y14_37315 [Streptomyces dioscori]|uniref:GerMN domain-containing protein n=1 Tax=Streptomyces dioscori TaxID=2109333 RepID=A0A2P8PWJ5_9ACTN|nr:hypothetical protein [Streptomyces dioscori]PSM38380.1 hypothetical protein C6Y14_37315 [Streptomyces dioscori]